MAKEHVVADELTFAQLRCGAKIEEFFQAHQKTFALGKDLGFSTREMVQLKEAGQLEGAVNQAYENIVKNPAMRESFELFEKAESFLKPYKEFIDTPGWEKITEMAKEILKAFNYQKARK